MVLLLSITIQYKQYSILMIWNGITINYYYSIQIMVVMAMKGPYILSRALEQESHHQMQFKAINWDSFLGRFYLSAEGTVSVF